MKINEKNLCAYAVSPSALADKEGYLMKRGDIHKAFHKRWFVLKGNLLFYFEKQGDKEPIGMIILEGCTIELEEMDAQYCFKIVFYGPGNRSYILCAESQESMEFWMKSLACASYDYMKSMVTELQRQLKETRCKGEKNLITDSTGANPSHSNESVSSLNSDSVVTPHPPPRSRARPQTSALLSRTRPNGAVTPVNIIKNPSPGYSPRNKVSFNSLHTTYGRPILRDRNVWKYDKKSISIEKNNCGIPKQHAIPEQNLLISL